MYFCKKLLLHNGWFTGDFRYIVDSTEVSDKTPGKFALIPVCDGNIDPCFFKSTEMLFAGRSLKCDGNCKKDHQIYQKHSEIFL